MSSSHCRIYCLLSLVLIVVILPMQPVSFPSLSNRPEAAFNHTFSSSYTPHAAFNITGDSGFAAQGWPGSGNESHPYRIESLNVTSETVCICIANTTKHFVIDDCFIMADLEESAEYAMCLTNVSNAMIRDSFIYGGFASLELLEVTDLVVSNNSFQNAHSGSVVGWNVNGSVFRGNRGVCGNGLEPFTAGFWFGRCINCTVENNRFVNVTYTGFRMTGIVNCSVTNNSLSAYDGLAMEGWRGIEVWGARDCSFAGNNVTGFWWEGIFAQYCASVGFTDNVVSGSAMGIAGQGTDLNITDNRITDCSTGIGMTMADRCLLLRNSISGSFAGIILDGGSDTKVSQNIIHDIPGPYGGYAGIVIQNTNRAIVQANHISDVSFGIQVTDQVNSGGNPPIDTTIADNVLDRSGLAFRLSGLDGYDQQVLDNTVNGKTLGYFYQLVDANLEGSGFGQIILVMCANVTVNGGSFHNVTEPVTLLHCTRCIVACCEIANSGGPSYSPEVYVGSVGIEKSYDCELTDIHAFEGEVGVSIRSCTNITVEGCELHNNSVGLWITASSDCRITANAVYYNGEGMAIASSTDCIVTANLVYNNTVVGITVDGTSARNRFYSNQIGWNRINALCYAASNDWDDGVSVGNRWSDYGGEEIYILAPEGRDNYPTLLTELITTTATGADLTAVLTVLGAVGVAAAVGIVFLVIIKKRGKMD